MRHPDTLRVWRRVVGRRAQMVLELLKKEVELCKLQADIREQVRVGSTAGKGGEGPLQRHPCIA